MRGTSIVPVYFRLKGENEILEQMVMSCKVCMNTSESKDVGRS